MKIARAMKFGVFLLTVLFIASCNSNLEDATISKVTTYTVFQKDSIVENVMYSLQNYGLNSQGRREALDSIILEYPSIAYFYQQRAMPLYKQDKDALGLPYLLKAAELNSHKYLDYKGFMECIFSKNYESAITDFEKYLQMHGDGYVMDHTYYFYIGISYLQLNEFEKAKIYLDKSISQSETTGGRDWVHFLDLLYLGIAQMELDDCQNAIKSFDEALVKYPSFGDVKYYKALCLYKLGKSEEAQKIFMEAKEDIIKGNTINEDNVIYERYPYQVRKAWFGIY